MEFNDLIFKELLKRGYSLEGNTRVWNVADSKLWYLKPEQAQAYLDYLDKEEYKGRAKEVGLIQKYITEIAKNLEKGWINIIDLGCGDGRKAVLFIEALKKKFKLRYCPIDISGYLTEKAIGNIGKLDAAEVVKVHWNISDFENLENIAPLLRKDEFKQNLFLLLGNTLGNFEIHDLLYQIRSSMKEGDILIIGNGLNNQAMEEPIKEVKASKGIDNFFAYMPLQIGLDKDDIEYDARFRNSRIEFFYTLKKDKTISFQSKKVHFTKGDQIIVAVTYHYEIDEFNNYLNMYFGEVNTYKTEDGSYALAVCRK